MSDASVQERENLPSPPNVPPGYSFVSKLTFLLRQIADLQVRSVYRELAPWLAGLKKNVLEVGCGAQPYRHLIPCDCGYQGLDWEKADEHFAYKAPDTVTYSGETFPFPDNSFSNLFHTEVLEHVYDFRLFLAECRRVMVPGGSLFFSVPFQARHHYIPFDYWRFTKSALQSILEEAGFKNVEIVTRGNDLTVAAYKFVSLSYRWLLGGIFGKLLGTLSIPLVFICLLAGHYSLIVKTGSEDDCLGYVVRATA